MSRLLMHVASGVALLALCLALPCWLMVVYGVLTGSPLPSLQDGSLIFYVLLACAALIHLASALASSERSVRIACYGYVPAAFATLATARLISDIGNAGMNALALELFGARTPELQWFMQFLSVDHNASLLNELGFSAMVIGTVGRVMFLTGAQSDEVSLASAK